MRNSPPPPGPSISISFGLTPLISPWFFRCRASHRWVWTAASAGRHRVFLNVSKRTRWESSAPRARGVVAQRPSNLEKKKKKRSYIFVLLYGTCIFRSFVRRPAPPPSPNHISRITDHLVLRKKKRIKKTSFHSPAIITWLLLPPSHGHPWLVLRCHWFDTQAEFIKRLSLEFVRRA